MNTISIETNLAPNLIYVEEILEEDSTQRSTLQAIGQIAKKALPYIPHLATLLLSALTMFAISDPRKLIPCKKFTVTYINYSPILASVLATMTRSHDDREILAQRVLLCFSACAMIHTADRMIDITRQNISAPSAEKTKKKTDSIGRSILGWIKTFGQLTIIATCGIALIRPQWLLEAVGGRFGYNLQSSQDMLDNPKALRILGALGLFSLFV